MVGLEEEVNMEFYIPTIEDIGKLRQAVKKNRKPGCEISPANTVLWAKHYNTEIAFWKDEVIYRSLMEQGLYSYACNLYSSDKPKELFEEIVKQSKEMGQPLRMHCVMEEEFQMIQGWHPDTYQIAIRRQDSDYIYLREKLATLAGKKLHSKRNHIHRFEENFLDWRYETITMENEDECAKMAMKWCFLNCADENDNWEYDKIDESKLVVYAIRHRDELGMIGGALRAGGEIIAITLGEPLTEDTFVVHFEKAFSDIQGAYPMINREFVRNELEQYTYVNREEDLGDEGLRRAKLSYRPVRLLEKGIVTELKR